MLNSLTPAGLGSLSVNTEALYAPVLLLSVPLEVQLTRCMIARDPWFNQKEIHLNIHQAAALGLPLKDGSERLCGDMTDDCSRLLMLVFMTYMQHSTLESQFDLIMVALASNHTRYTTLRMQRSFRSFCKRWHFSESTTGMFEEKQTWTTAVVYGVWRSLICFLWASIVGSIHKCSALPPFLCPIWVQLLIPALHRFTPHVANSEKHAIEHLCFYWEDVPAL